MRTGSQLVVAIAGFIAAGLPGVAQARVVSADVPGIRIAGWNSETNQYTYERKTIRISFEHDDDWNLRCGEYVSQALLMRLGPAGQQHYERHQLARILGSIDRIEIRRVRGGITGTPTPSTFYYGGSRRLVVEFNINSGGSGMEYCGLEPRGGTLRAVHQAWGRFERFSRRRDDAEASLASAPAPGDSRPVVDVAAGDRATTRALSGFMDEAINAVGGIPAAPREPAATDRRTAPVRVEPRRTDPETDSVLPEAVEAR